ncbi:uncharacterized protein LOC122737177 [Dromiciops gliroides]|uniref:uncharacterized protein LOC122737177 n=1 Tax=Dromiciops gliroides TaxID=33562 RepID=UPI001CC47EBF|nr:uncharacterized protein LOC122737177 [Dromiciops gliroides]
MWGAEPLGSRSPFLERRGKDREPQVTQWEQQIPSVAVPTPTGEGPQLGLQPLAAAQAGLYRHPGVADPVLPQHLSEHLAHTWGRGGVGWRPRPRSHLGGAHPGQLPPPAHALLRSNPTRDPYLGARARAGGRPQSGPYLGHLHPALGQRLAEAHLAQEEATGPDQGSLRAQVGVHGPPFAQVGVKAGGDTVPVGSETLGLGRGVRGRAIDQEGDPGQRPRQEGLHYALVAPRAVAEVIPGDDELHAGPVHGRRAGGTGLATAEPTAKVGREDNEGLSLGGSAARDGNGCLVSGEERGQRRKLSPERGGGLPRTSVSCPAVVLRLRRSRLMQSTWVSADAPARVLTTTFFLRATDSLRFNRETVIRKLPWLLSAPGSHTKVCLASKAFSTLGSLLEAPGTRHRLPTPGIFPWLIPHAWNVPSSSPPPSKSQLKPCLLQKTCSDPACQGLPSLDYFLFIIRANLLGQISLLSVSPVRL